MTEQQCQSIAGTKENTVEKTNKILTESPCMTHEVQLVTTVSSISRDHAVEKRHAQRILTINHPVILVFNRQNIQTSLRY